MIWWIWILIGLALLAAELATPGGFYILFFGFGAIGTGALAGAGLLEPLWLQCLVFTVLSVALLVLLRRRLMAGLQPAAGPGRGVDSLIGEIALVIEAVPADGPGKVELRGTAWSARALGGAALARGRRCRVERVDGLTLWVRSE